MSIMPLLVLPFTVILQFVIFPIAIFAQELPRTAFGVFGDAADNLHTSNFTGLPGIASCCPDYNGGSGFGFAAGGLARFPFSQMAGIQLRADLQSHNATLTSTKNNFPVFFNNTLTPGAFQYTMDAKIMSVGISPLLDIHSVADLHLLVGMRAGLVLSPTFAQQETILQPSNGGTFADGAGGDSHSRIRNAFGGAIPGASSLQLALLIGVSYEFPMNPQRTLLLSPEILYSYAFTPVASGITWNANALRAGVALMLAPRVFREERRMDEKIDTVRRESPAVTRETFVAGRPERKSEVSEIDDRRIITEHLRRTDTIFTSPAAPRVPVLTAGVRASGLDATGAEIPVVRLIVEEFASTLMTPLLNYVFFDENSDAIPGRYQRMDRSSTASFTEKNINDASKLPTYHHVLNIIGKRLREHPGVAITLVGCNQDIRTEKNNTDLSKRRAEAVKQYLTDVWNIDGKRITVQSRNLPEKAANTQTQDGAEENRRVEIQTDEWDIVAPVITNDTILSVNPPSVRLYPMVQAEAGVLNWSLDATQQERTLKHFDGLSVPPASIDWHINAERATAPRYEGEMTFVFSVIDSGKHAMHLNTSIPVEQITIYKKRIERRGDKEIDRFSLILFDVRSAEITATNKRISDIIKSAIKPTSTISITGYTDRLGDQAFNQQLAQSRAQATARVLGSDKAVVRGIGQAQLYDSTFPEGRLYTRTVDIVVETPVEH